MSEAPENNQDRPLARLFDRVILGNPIPVVVLVCAVSLFFGYYIKDFKLDASSDSIVLENDPDLRYYNETRELFGSDDYVIVTVTPPDTPESDLFSEATLAELKNMVADFEAMQSVESVTSILSVPLFHSPDVSLLFLATGYKTLMEDADRELARVELVESPLYQDYLISKDGKTSSVQVNFKTPEPEYAELYRRRAELRDKRRAGRSAFFIIRVLDRVLGRSRGLTGEEKAELNQVEKDYAARHGELSEERGEDIETIRSIIDKYRPSLGELYLGGVPMIVADIISYVESDIFNFGMGVVVFVLIMLAFIFRQMRWIVFPTLTCVLTVLIMMGYLGFMKWRTTIVTSNFTSLLLVITIAMAMHIAVRFREIYAGNPDLSHRELLLQAVSRVAKPCLYTSLTTIVGFGSLIVSGIRPVMDFGYMMAIGICVAYALCFVFLPALLVLLPKGKVPPAKLAQLTQSPVAVFARFTEKHGKIVAAGSIILFAVCAIGAARLEVENRFIDYFREKTPIYQGMTIIDERLGGTTPLEIVLKGEGEDFWFKTENLARLREFHDYLDGLPETGKVISPATMIRILEKVNKGNPLSQQMLLIIRSRLPDDISRAVIKPYATSDFTQVRIAMRVRESDKELQRQELLNKITDYFEARPDIAIEDVRVTGMFVLYNNMLQSLVSSQIKTIGTVFFAVWFMFFVLFRSASLATIAIIPNILPVVLVLGTLGWAGIPLDMMTIMIAAITLGIAVDFAIHYIHRFQKEFPKDRDYRAAMYRCHNSIGRAIFYTSITIIAGFSILTFSNFIPTIYFGLFTGMAMVVALLASVTLLPLLLISWKPLGPEGDPGADLTAPEESVP